MLIGMVTKLQKALSQKGIMTASVIIDRVLIRLMMFEEKLLYCIPVLKGSNKMVQHLNFTKESIWLMLVEDGILIEQLFQDVYIPFDTEFLVAQAKESIVEITEVYREAKKKPLSTFNYGIWSENSSITWPNRQIYERRRAFYNLTLKAGGMSGRPIIQTKMVNGNLEIASGAIKPIVEVLKNHLNFRLHLSEPDDRKWGAFENGVWTGLAGMLAYKKVDFIVNIISMSEEKIDVMDFGTPILLARILLYMQKPTTSGMTWRSYVQPFSTELWISVILIIFIIATVLAVLESRNVETDLEPVVPSFTSALICVIGAFCSQGIYKRYPSSTLRFAILSNFITSVVLVSSYSAFIISYLTTRKIETPFKDFTGILNDGSYKMGVLAHSSSYNMFQLTNDSLRLQVYNKLIAPIEDNLPPTTNEGLHRVCSDIKFMYLTTEIIAKAYFELVPCQVVNVPNVKYNAHFTLPTVKNSPYTGIFSYTVLKLIEGGILKKLTSYLKDSYKGETDFNVQSITLDNTSTIFVLLSLGSITSIILLMLEILWFKIYKCLYIRANKYCPEEKQKKL